MSDLNDEKTDLSEFSRAMKRDWNDRAREDSRWYINSLRVGQSEEEFDKTGAVEVERLVAADLPLLAQGRDPKSLRVLEIGCGAGRMTRYLAEIFGEVVGIDVSGEMVVQARERLAGKANAQFHETDGVDLAIFEDENFDLILSAFVFQHVPDASVIASNIREAWRVLKPDGVFRFQTNSVTSAAFERSEKDTWAGAVFGEKEIRRFAREAGAQLISIFGAGTQYCWTTLCKRPARDAQIGKKMQPRIQFHGRTVDAADKTIPVEGHQASLTVIASGIDRDLDDCNSMGVAINELIVRPRYAGPVGRNFEAALISSFGPGLDHLTQIEIGLPNSVRPGAAKVRIQTGDGVLSEPVEVEFIRARPVPKIGTVMNAHDNGTDVCARGEKSRLKILVEGLDETADPQSVRVQIGDRIVEPESVVFHPGNAIHEIVAQLPEAIAPGPVELRLHSGDVQSPAAAIEVITDIYRLDGGVIPFDRK
jgi:ubiquinone/menaquinone biosynthesis C-methylase UbiE